MIKTKLNLVSRFFMIQGIKQQGKVIRNFIDVIFIAVATFFAGTYDWKIGIHFIGLNPCIIYIGNQKCIFTEVL